MYLSTYLKSFRSIAWYPSSDLDLNPIAYLNWNRLAMLGLHPKDFPDCFLFTDYHHVGVNDPYASLIFDLENGEFNVKLPFPDGQEAIACNVLELEPLDLDYDKEMTGFDHDGHYGRVFTFDLFVKAPDQPPTITKVVYIVTENAIFARDFLLKEHIRNIRFIIHHDYGFGFGGGKSTGAFLPHLFKDLGTCYFVSDMEVEGSFFYQEDVADRYLTEEQLSTYPILVKWPVYDETGEEVPLWPSMWPTYLYDIVQCPKGPREFKLRFVLEEE